MTPAKLGNRSAMHKSFHKSSEDTEQVKRRKMRRRKEEMRKIGGEKRKNPKKQFHTK
jgi:hypothetical protein